MIEGPSQYIGSVDHHNDLEEKRGRDDGLFFYTVPMTFHTGCVEEKRQGDYLVPG